MYTLFPFISFQIDFYGIVIVNNRQLNFNLMLSNKTLSKSEAATAVQYPAAKLNKESNEKAVHRPSGPIMWNCIAIVWNCMEHKNVSYTARLQEAAATSVPYFLTQCLLVFIMRNYHWIILVITIKSKHCKWFSILHFVTSKYVTFKCDDCYYHCK